ncbi:hypothetical protein E1A91_A08G208400v1 [Gossypium mustelinum]|uniref:Fe2OG dioxygenase domain-containing protein n=2 Tax=Gossypium TaxID=3633 RepID=A0A5D2YCI8_GOSMU|nr:hypothetical protein ES332_A08G222100v1 [Gossypium tomentosum]TYJ23669.1 hypothetical protein E1A91_A08G208400v1 [Gossypium mustelinum]
MDKLVSSWYKDQSLPESYIFPPHERPGKLLVPRCNTVPVIDLGDTRTNLVHQILKASQEFGLFQVVNHGVPPNIMSETMSVFHKFFELPAEDKASLTVHTNDPKRCKLVTSTLDYDREKIHLWRDVLRHPCHPDCIEFWPQKPLRYREVVAACSIEAKKLGLQILELLCEGVGIEHGYFEHELTEDLLLGANHYPPCPDPSLTLGIPKHFDPDILTILLQEHISGLQVLKDGEWIGVKPIPNAFVVNIGYILQVISNNKLKGAEHRVVTNSSDHRISVVFCMNPAGDSNIEPAKSVVTATNPPLCRGFQFKEFMDNFYSMDGDADLALQPFKL